MSDIKKTLIGLAEVQSTMLITDESRSKIIRAINEIKKLQAENAELKKQGEWISVDDELPSKDGNYLTYEKGRVHSADHCVCWFSSKFGFDLIGTTHWMPLPTPSKGG